MSIALYESGDGALALRRCPVADARGDRPVTLQYRPHGDHFGASWAWVDADGYAMHYLYPDDALAVIERSHRIALDEKNVWLELRGLCWRVCRAGGLWLTESGIWSPSETEAGYWGEYAKALIAAVLATFGEEGAK